MRIGANEPRRFARIFGLASLAIAGGVVLFYVVLKAMGLPDHPFG